MLPCVHQQAMPLSAAERKMPFIRAHCVFYLARGRSNVSASVLFLGAEPLPSCTYTDSFVPLHKFTECSIHAGLQLSLPPPELLALIARILL